MHSPKHVSCKTSVCFVKFSDTTKATLTSRTLTPSICHGACLHNFHHLDMPGASEKGAQAPEGKTSTRANFPPNSTPNIVISAVLFICACWQVDLSVILNHFEYSFSLLNDFKLFIQDLVLCFHQSSCLVVLSVAKTVVGDPELGCETPQGGSRLLRLVVSAWTASPTADQERMIWKMAILW